ncbi:MAG TPA: CHASE2 domain-containing protein, partial [Allocoleopsis sp.]
THQVITLLKLGDNKVEIPPPPGTPADRVGFSDLVVDADSVIRRNLMLASFSEQEVFVSFSLRLALTYLAPQGITPQNPPQNPSWFQLGKTIFPPLQPTSGGYQTLDAGGYQILLDYSSPTRPARSISFLQALQGNFDRTWVRDKIVLIGTTAPSGKDLFSTPYSASAIVDHQMPGVVLHAQMVSQILRSTLDGKPPFWFFPTWVEAIWIAIWAAMGVSLAWSFNHPLKLAVVLSGSLLLLSGITIGLFFMQAWMPLVAPVMAFVLAGIVIVSYRAYRVSN